MKMKVLKSGNILKYEEVSAARSGGIRATFTSPPTDAEMKEGQAFLESLVPQGHRTYEQGIVIGTEQEASALLHSRLGIDKN